MTRQKRWRVWQWNWLSTASRFPTTVHRSCVTTIGSFFVIDQLINGAEPIANALRVMLTWADIKVRESDGKNRGPIVDAIHELAGGDDDDAAAWCARAVVASWTVGGWAAGKVLDPKISTSGSVFYLMHSTMNRAPEQVILADLVKDPVAEIPVGSAMIRYTVRPEHKGVKFGDLKRRMTHKGHTETVVKVYPNGNLDTVGGNTDSDDGRDGDGVYLHSRRYNIAEERVVGFVVPRWVDA